MKKNPAEKPVNPAEKPGKSKRNLRPLLITVAVVVFALLLATIGFLIYYIIKGDASDKNGTAKDNRPTVVTKENVDEVVSDLDKPVPDGSYEVAMNTKWHFKGDTSDAYVENSTANTRTVYFDVTLANTDELVYSSPYIPVGEKVQEFALDQKLEAGTYNAVVTYHLVDDNHEEVSNLAVTVTLEVE